MLHLIKGLFNRQMGQVKEGDILSADNLGADLGQRIHFENTPIEQDPVDGKAGTVQTQLSFHPSWEHKLSSAQKTFMREEQQELPPIRLGEIALHGIYAVLTSKKLDVAVYFRNATARPIHLDRLPLAVVDRQGNVLARQEFPLEELGTIPPFSTRPWELIFKKKNVFVKNISPDDWKIVFDQQLEFEEWVTTPVVALPATVPDEERRHLEEYSRNLPPLKTGQIDLAAYQAFWDGQNLGILAFIRNGHHEALQFQELPLAVQDAWKRDVAVGQFVLDDLVIRPKTCQIRLFTFSPECLLFPANQIDLSRWAIYVKTNTEPIDAFQNRS